MAILPLLSTLLGWTYFSSWSASFYPQPILNYRRSTTSGTTVDFPLINTLGYASYLASNLGFYSSALVRRQYAQRYGGLTPTVRLNDVAFALHALLLSVLTASQYLVPTLWGITTGPTSVGAPARPSRFILGICAGSLLAVLAVAVLVALSPRTGDAASDWCELDLVYAVGYVKVVVTLVKYTPQILANRRNRSTRGWSIWQILLDVAGGLLSIAQLAIDSYLQRDWSGVTGNPIKLAIGNASLVFDSVFIVQHYLLYPASRDGERQRLLPDDEDGRVHQE